MKKLFVMVLALCAGCSIGGEDNSCLNTHGFDNDVTGETGLTLLATTPHYTYITFEEMEAEYIDLERCAANTNTPGPYVRFVDFRHLIPGYSSGAYIFLHQTVYMDVNPNLTPQRNCISDREILRHEFLHHVLHMNGEDASHANPKFAECKALGPKTCNGEYCE